MCYWASQHYKRRRLTIGFRGADGKACVIIVLKRSTRVRVLLLANFFSPFSNFKSHHIREAFICNKKCESKVSGRVRVGVYREGFCPNKVASI